MSIDLGVYSANRAKRVKKYPEKTRFTLRYAHARKPVTNHDNSSATIGRPRQSTGAYKVMMRRSVVPPAAASEGGDRTEVTAVRAIRRLRRRRRRRWRQQVRGDDDHGEGDRYRPRVSRGPRGCQTDRPTPRYVSPQKTTYAWPGRVLGRGRGIGKSLRKIIIIIIITHLLHVRAVRMSNRFLSVNEILCVILVCFA